MHYWEHYIDTDQRTGDAAFASINKGFLTKSPEPEWMVAERDYLPVLGVLRFIAALLVLFNHMATYSYKIETVTAEVSERAFPVLSAFETVGAVGVEVFFVISGFVIAFSASHRHGGLGAAEFAVARVMRIFPTLWISTCVAFCALWISGWPISELLPRLARSLLLSPKGPHIDGVIWTLLLEAVFYALIAICIWQFKRAPLRMIAIELGSTSCLFLSVFLLAFVTGHLNIWESMNGFAFTLFLGRHGVFFAIGILLWSIQFERKGRWDIWLTVFMGFAFVEIWFAMNQNWTRFCSVIGLLSLLILLIAASLHCPRFSFGERLARWLGDLSYPLYLNHYTFGMCVTVWLAADGQSQFVHLILSLGAILMLSVAVMYLEKALRQRFQPRGIFKTIVRLPLT